MAEKVDTFISFQHEDVMQARGLRLLNSNPNHKVSFVERSFIDPIKGKNDAEVWKQIQSEIDKSKAVLVLVGNKTHQSTWVSREVDYARKQGIGVTAMQLPGKENAKDPKFLTDAGIKVLPWNPDGLNKELARAAAEGRQMQTAIAAPQDGAGC